MGYVRDIVFFLASLSTLARPGYLETASSSIVRSIVWDRVGRGFSGAFATRGKTVKSCNEDLGGKKDLEEGNQVRSASVYQWYNR